MDNHILQFWDSQADKFGISHSASWDDNYAIEIKIKVISKRLVASSC